MKKKNFFKGMDISSLPEYFACGEVFYDGQGNPMEPFTFLADHGVNSIRLRLWNEPERVPESGGWCGLADTVTMGRRIKAHGMHFVLDFHYSDYWADPERQQKPYAWKQLSFPELKQAVYDYTYEVLTTLRNAGCLPDMVQVGNEIRNGMLFPDGAVPNYDRLAALLNAGIRAVRDISPEITVMLHLDQGGRFCYIKRWFDAMFDAGLQPIDAIGLSFYSFWHGTFMDLRDTMRGLIERYHLPVCVAETAHPWRNCPDGQVSEETMKNAGLPAGIKEQAQSLQLVMQITASMPDDMGMGVYYWEPLCVPCHNHGRWAENMGMLDANARALPAFDVYRDFTRASHPIEDPDSYMESLYVVDETAIPPAGTNLILNGDFAEGDIGWWMLRIPNEIETVFANREVYVSSEEEFTFQLFANVYTGRSGHYVLSADYFGGNAAGAKITLFLKVISWNEEKTYRKEIIPTDNGFVSYELDAGELPAGQIQVGIHIESPPIYAHIRNFRLVEV